MATWGDIASDSEDDTGDEVHDLPTINEAEAAKGHESSSNKALHDLPAINAKGHQSFSSPETLSSFASAQMPPLPIASTSSSPRSAPLSPAFGATKLSASAPVSSVVSPNPNDQSPKSFFSPSPELSLRSFGRGASTSAKTFGRGGFILNAGRATRLERSASWSVDKDQSATNGRNDGLCGRSPGGDGVADLKNLRGKSKASGRGSKSSRGGRGGGRGGRGAHNLRKSNSWSWQKSENKHYRRGSGPGASPPPGSRTPQNGGTQSPTSVDMADKVRTSKGRKGNATEDLDWRRSRSLSTTGVLFPETADRPEKAR
eukprot:gb/GEZN01009404.1/.p1 GENE.gb/GEZN01009404.1/~~gb/GEZN01009404.1/.p1  ORF type:complete len:315 (-),score=41.86 gb/GEZN01009404.1/:287-1231(-)